ncbi:MAG: DCC1-like thiol-disulfide oxidoreductase family protein [Terriglobales bacterium]
MFYDGHCALCHGVVRFLLAVDKAGLFVFAPLQSNKFAKLPGSSELAGEQTVVVATQEGSLLTKSRAILYLLRELGGFWRIVAWLGRVIPAVIADAAYDFIARVRYRIFGRKEALCPLVPEELRSRLFSGTE